MRKTILRLNLLLLILTCSLGLKAQTELAESIDSVVQSVYLDDMPGATIIVVQDGETIYRGAKGMANVELGVPLRADMVFRIGSITKQFTAASILLLEEQGKLNVQNSIGAYLPDYPTEHGISV
jgi:CubicO group peptidase (beta-lactamase class C family)|tara:strand:+ start:193 stop:564 length:372 start_codon:yes stop_codon:yes gene_type:complete